MSNPSEPHPPAPARNMSCPKCGVRLSVEVPDEETIIVCPKCFTEFTPPPPPEPGSPADSVPSGSRPQGAERKGALKHDLSPEARARRERREKARAEAERDERKGKVRPKRPSPLPVPELVEPVKSREGVPLEEYHRQEASSGLVKLLLLVLVLVGGSVLVWVLLYQAQTKDRQTISSTSEPRAGNEIAPVNPPAPAPSADVPKPSKAPAPEPAPQEAPRLTSDQEEAVRAAEYAANALAAPTWQELLSHVRAPAAVKPLMRGYYAEQGPFRPERANAIISANIGTTEQGQRVAYVSLQMPDYREQRVLLERTGNGVYLVDWESLVGHQPVSWTRFLRDKPRSVSEFRVGVELLMEAPSQVPSLPGVIEPLDNYFPFGLKAGFEGEPTLAYMKNTAPGATDFYARLQGGQRFDAILKLRFTEIEGAGEVIEITELVQYGWMKGYGAAAPDGGPVRVEKQPF